MAQPSSGTTAFQPALSDIVVESFSRIQVRPTSFTADHMLQARMSANYLISEWQTKNGPNLFSVILTSVPLVQGVATYSLPPTTINLLDVYIRQFQVGAPVNFAPAFTTLISSTAVTVGWTNHGLLPGQWMSVVVPVTEGGIVLLGFYQVVTVTSANAFTITAASAATASAGPGGTVPLFTPTLNSTTVSVTLANHGLYANQNFSVQVPTLVGGQTLSGVYPVVSVTSSSVFTITAPQPMGSNTAVSENGGNAQLEGQLPNTDPQDRVLFPISRTEYSAQPDKAQQAYPTTFWFDRIINPTVTLWPVPDQNGPYTFNYYSLSQTQDATLPQGATMAIPYRFYEAFAAGLAAKLAIKYPPPPPNSFQIMKTLAEEAWQWAAMQDVEEVPLYITPGLTSYFR